MSKRANCRRYSTSELEEKSVQICLNCPMADCVGSAGCSYLRSRLAEMGLITAKKKPANERTCPAKHYVEYDGKLYTLRQMAEMSGADFHVTQNRYYYGWTGREMMQGHRDPKSMRRENNRAAEKYEYEGKFYTVRQMAELCGVSRTAVRKRLRMGWTVKEILQNHREDKRKLSVDIHVGVCAKVVEYEGREYTYKELAEICGTPYRTIKGRVYSGWTIKEILQNHRDGKKERQSMRTKEAMTHEEQNSGAESERESRSNGA